MGQSTKERLIEELKKQKNGASTRFLCNTIFQVHTPGGGRIVPAKEDIYMVSSSFAFL